MVLSATASFLSTDLFQKLIAAPNNFVFELEHLFEDVHRVIMVYGLRVAGL